MVALSDSVQPHRRQPTRLPHPWDSAGKNTGVGCHFLLQCMKVKSQCEVTQSCLTISDPMDCSLPGSLSMGFSRQEYWSGVPQPSPFLKNTTALMGLPGGTSGKEPICHCRRHKRCGFNPWIRKIPWSKNWQSTPLVLPGESHGQRSLMEYGQ